MMTIVRTGWNSCVAGVLHRVTQVESLSRCCWQSRTDSRGANIVNMFPYSVLGLCLTVIVPYVTTHRTANDVSFRNEKLEHRANQLSDDQIEILADLTDMQQMNETLNKICIVRAVGTEGHKEVKNYLKDTMYNLGWTVETDAFTDRHPNNSVVQFENIIAKLNPNARRYLTMACHYDSKVMENGVFVGATDSAVPCAQLLNLATVMRGLLNSAKTSELSLMFIFFDGEEAFVHWNEKDSIYGARHLATKWHNVKRTIGTETDITDLDKMDMLMLLDLLGAPDPTFYSYFDDTNRWYGKLVNAERTLAAKKKFENYSYGKQSYFQPYSIRLDIADDHLPFLNKNVPIVHLIPHPFPKVWHTVNDDLKFVDMKTTENLNKILRVFVASYLNLDVKIR